MVSRDPFSEMGENSFSRYDFSKVRAPGLDVPAYILRELETIAGQLAPADDVAYVAGGEALEVLSAQLQYIGLIPPEFDLISYADISPQAVLCSDLLDLLSSRHPAGGGLGLQWQWITRWGDLLPTSRLYQYLRAKQEYEAGHPAEALIHLQRALSINNVCPGSQKLLEKLARRFPDTPGIPAHLVDSEEYLRDKFCVVPFISLTTGWKGDAFACTCPAWLPYKTGNLLEGSGADAIWNSPAAVKIRESILDGSFTYCSRTLCSLIVGRTLGTLAHNQKYAQPGWPADPQPVMKEAPLSVELNHDASCNLACPSCRTEVRMADAAEVDRLAVASERVILPLLRPMRGQVYITGGGEPFASRHFRNLLRTLNPVEFPHLSILLMTNAQLVHEEMWGEFESMEPMLKIVSVSVDAARAATYENLRRPGKWRKLVEGVAFLAGLRRTGRIRCLRLNFVVQEENLAEVPGFIRLAREWKADYVWFQKMANYGSFSAEEFRSKDISNPHHPRFPEFLAIFQDPEMQGRDVDASMFDGIVPGTRFLHHHRHHGISIMAATGDH